mmetsp:Transcript_6970/g.10204  ORF Transcript_6970/g.10204 Transcript_6970/m.10204 type:complete len:497 (+) Transcript_6970:141-1631(+)
MKRLFKQNQAALRINANLQRAYGTKAGDYDVVVVGGGPGGYVAAIKAAQLGLKTACVEKRGALGGTCLNVGCIPSKALLNGTHKLHEAHHEFKEWGIEGAENLSVNLDQLMSKKDEAVTGLTQGIEGLFKKNKVDYVKGWGKIKDKNTIEVEGKEYGTKNIIIATGSEPTELPFMPFDEEKIVSSTGALALKEIPKKMVVVGGGVIGLELGSVWSRMGAEVTVVEYAPEICPFLDNEVAKEFNKILKKQGINFHLSTGVTGFSKNDDGTVTLNLEKAPTAKKSQKTPETIDADVVLVSVGRKPYTEGLGLENVGVETDKLGRVVTDKNLKTNVEGIYAIGDVTDGVMLAHKAETEGEILVESIAEGKQFEVNYNAIPSVIYTHPEVADVGASEQELKEQGIKYKVGKFPMMANSRARANFDTAGFVKILSDAETDRVLGVHIVSSVAGELIGEVTLAVDYGGSAEDIARTCHAHPTVSEAIKEAAMLAHEGKCIHF